MLAFPLLTGPYAQALDSVRQDEREGRLRRSNGSNPFARIPDDEDDETEEDETEQDFENDPTRPLRLDRLHL